MKFSFYSKKKLLIAGFLINKYIYTFGVVLSYSHSRVCWRQKSLFQRSSALFCATLEQAGARSNAANQKNVFIPLQNDLQRAVENPEAV